MATLDGHSSGTYLAARLARPTRATGRKCPCVTRSVVSHRRAAGRPYSVLLPVGFTLPPPSPGARCALTAPFHPCLLPCAISGRQEQAVCFLWHFPWGRPRRPLAGTVFPWSPDFPPMSRSNPAEQGGAEASAAVQPSGQGQMRVRRRQVNACLWINSLASRQKLNRSACRPRTAGPGFRHRPGR